MSQLTSAAQNQNLTTSTPGNGSEASSDGPLLNLISVDTSKMTLEELQAHLASLRALNTTSVAMTSVLTKDLGNKPKKAKAVSQADVAKAMDLLGL